MSPPALLSPSQAEPQVAEMFKSGDGCVLSVSEERAFKSRWLPLGTVSLASTELDDSALTKLVQRGAFEWRLPDLNESIATASKLLDAKDDDGRVRKSMDEVASIAARVGLIHPRFDPMAIEQMPFRRSTTVVADTSGVLQGALDFVARYLHPAARVKVPAIAQMEIANQADRFLRIRRARKAKGHVRELMEHLTSQGGQRALLRLELHSDNRGRAHLPAGGPATVRVREGFGSGFEGSGPQLTDSVLCGPVDSGSRPTPPGPIGSGACGSTSDRRSGAGAHGAGRGCPPVVLQRDERVRRVRPAAVRKDFPSFLGVCPTRTADCTALGAGHGLRLGPPRTGR